MQTPYHANILIAGELGIGSALGRGGGTAADYLGPPDFGLIDLAAPLG